MSALTTEELIDNCPWMFPDYRWEYYGSLLYKAKTYAEFALNAVIRGYVNPDTTRRHDEKIDLVNRHEPYECFIYEEAASWRGSGKLTRKACRFRDEMIELEKRNGERDADGAVIPTRWQIKHDPRVREWCRRCHPEFFRIRG